MADFNKPKNPSLPSGGSSPAPAPKAPVQQKPSNLSAPKQNPMSTPKAQPQAPKIQTPNVNPTREKIINQGFSPNSRKNNVYSPARKPNEGESRQDYINNLMGEGYSKEDAIGWGDSHFFDQKEQNQAEKDFDFAEKEAKADKKSIQDYNSEKINNFKEMYEKGIDPLTQDKETAFDNAFTALYGDDYDMYDEQYQKLREEVGLGRKEIDPKARQLHDSDDLDEWNNEDNPGSAVVSGRLMDYVRGKLSEDPELSPQFIDKMVKGLYNDSNQADYYKGKMKEDWERKKASKLYGTELNKKAAPEPSWLYATNAEKNGNFNYSDARKNGFKHPTTGEESSDLYFNSNYTGPGYSAFEGLQPMEDPDDFGQNFEESFRRFPSTEKNLYGEPRPGEQKFYEDADSHVWDALSRAQKNASDTDTVRDIISRASEESGIDEDRLLNALLFQHFYFGNDFAFRPETNFKKLSARQDEEYKKHLPKI